MTNTAAKIVAANPEFSALSPELALMSGSLASVLAAAARSDWSSDEESAPVSGVTPTLFAATVAPIAAC